MVPPLPLVVRVAHGDIVDAEAAMLVVTHLNDVRPTGAEAAVDRVLERLDAGDHDALILEPIAAQRDAEEEELTFHRAKRIEPGHAP